MLPRTVLLLRVRTGRRLVGVTSEYILRPQSQALTLTSRKAGCRCWMKAGEDQAGTCGLGKGCIKKGGTCVLKEEVDLETMDKVGKCGKACLCVVMKETEP